MTAADGIAIAHPEYSAYDWEREHDRVMDILDERTQQLDALRAANQVPRKAERIVIAIGAMHVPYTSPRSGRHYCKECETEWPCATNQVIAIIGASEAE